MYREPHLNHKSKECSEIWYEWYELFREDKTTKECKELRKKWCKCANELGKMVSQEVNTNPRYKGKTLDVKHPEPPR